MSDAANTPFHQATIRSVSAFGLAGSLLELPAQPLDEAGFVRLSSAVRRQRLTGLFWAAIEGGALPTTESQRERAEAAHVRVLTGVLALEELLVDTARLFADEQIPVRVLKGSALAHLDFPDPALRPFGDIDLLIPGTRFDDAVALLVGRGCTRRFPDPRPGFYRRFGKGASVRTPEGLEIDLHRSFSMGPFGERLALDDIWSACEVFEVAGEPLTTLPVEVRLLHACYHAALGDRVPQLAPLRDVAQILLSSNPDWTVFQRLMQRSRGQAVVAHAVRTAWTELAIADVLIVSAWAESYRASPRAKADISVYGVGSSYATRCFASVRALPTWEQRASYLAALTMPDRSYLDGRHSGHRDRLQRGLTEILHGRSRP